MVLQKTESEWQLKSWKRNPREFDVESILLLYHNEFKSRRVQWRSLVVFDDVASTQ